MCLVVDYSEKLVKSIILGLKSIIGGEKSKKIGIFAIQMLIFTESSYEHPNIRIFDLKHTVECFCSRIHRKLGIFDEIFPKNWKIRNYW